LPIEKKLLVSTQVVNGVSSTECCPKICVQPFPRAKIKIICTQFYVQGNVFFRKHRLLDVHRQIHLNGERKEMISLEGIEACPNA